MAINSVIGGIQTQPILPRSGDAKKAGSGFGGSLSGLIGSVESSNQAANDAVGKMVEGTGDVHDAMIALQRADLTFQFSVQVRNKLVQAYQEIMRMPV